MTNDEIIRAAVLRVLDFGETPVEAVAKVIARRLIYRAAEEWAVAHWALSA
jgi:hypothetical protein